MIGPGIPNPMMFSGGGDPLDEYFKILRSVRLRAAATPRIERTTGASGGDRDKWFVLLNFKRGTLGTIQYLHGADTSSPDAIYINASDKLCIDIAGTNRLVSSRVFRDPAAHYIALVVFDAANATAASRLRVYVADSPSPEVTAWDTDTRSGITAGSSKTMHNSILHVIGKNPAAANGYFDGYISEHRIGTWSGAAPALVDHCSLHPRINQWRPKSFVGSYGAHGSRLDFSDASSLANLCLDRSGNGNNWTAVNISLTPGVTYDSMLDTPTDVSCAWNPLVPGDSAKSNGNLDAAGTTRGTMDATAIPCQWEITANAASVVGGVVSESGTASTVAIPNGSTYGFRLSGGVLEYTTNGSSWASIATGLTGVRVPYASGGSNTLNCGQRPMVYALSPGFRRLSTKNLPIKPRVMLSIDAFAANTNSGANIIADLSASSPWSDWIRIYKRRDAAEGWRWQFSDDPGNALDSSSSSGVFAFPALTGTSYVGYALKVSAANGVATGRLVHTNGVASVVTDGLANSRKAVILKSEATGDWFFYHPDLTPGCLLRINVQAGEIASAAINSVTASGFTVDSALASGTYRWVSLAETSGFLKLYKYAANGSADGPYANGDGRPAFSLIKARNFTDYTNIHDSTRSPANPAALTLTLGVNLGEGSYASTNTIDLASSGVKIRNGGGSGYVNTSGYEYVGLVINEFSFRYANAR